MGWKLIPCLKVLIFTLPLLELDLKNFALICSEAHSNQLKRPLEMPRWTSLLLTILFWLEDQQEFPKSKNCYQISSMARNSINLNPDEAVAYGAAVQAAI